MTTTALGAPAPEHLEPRFAAFVAIGDLDGIMSLYAVDAVVSLPRGREAAGSAAIRAAFASALASGAFEGCRPEDATARAVVSGDLAMTTSTAADGTVRTQVARREADGSWVWVRDGSRLRDVAACLPPAACQRASGRSGTSGSSGTSGMTQAVA
jgi:ketosteroid isomerase-like protein